VERKRESNIFVFFKIRESKILFSFIFLRNLENLMREEGQRKLDELNLEIEKLKTEYESQQLQW
jgi:hypothetical protein